MLAIPMALHGGKEIIMQRSIEMNYKMVDFSTWPRGDLFRFYMDHMRVVMSLTVDLETLFGRNF